MNYRGLSIQTPPRAGTYVPLNVHEWSFAQDDLVYTAKAVVPSTAANGFASIDGAVFPATVVPPRVLTDQLYKMSDLYPETYQTMTECPEAYDCSQLTKTNGMFKNCTQLVEAPLIDLNNNKVLCGYMFQNCSSLTTVQFANTSGTKGFSFMFDGCSALTSVGFIDTSSVDTAGLGFNSMFDGCVSLPSTFPWTIDVGRLTQVADTGDIDYAFGYMFHGSSVTEVTFSHASATIRSVLADGTVLKHGGMTVHFVDNAD